MNQSGMKNMVILRNLPSNIVEEAIIILKTNKKVKKAEKIEKSKMQESQKSKIKGNEYILKEAEMLVSNYISRLEEKKNEKKVNNMLMNQKYRRVKKYAYTATVVIIIESLLLFIK